MLSAFRCISWAPAPAILGSIHPNSSSFLISFLYWRTPYGCQCCRCGFTGVKQRGIIRSFDLPAARVLISARSSFSLLWGHAADSCSEPVPAHGVVLYQVYDFEFAFIELHNVSVIPFLLPVCCGEVTCQSGVGTAPSKWQNSL